MHRRGWNVELCLQYIYSEIGCVPCACYRWQKKEIPELTMCSAECDKEFYGPEMFVCRVLCRSRVQFHTAKQHFCLDVLFYMTDPWTNPAAVYLTGRKGVGRARLSGMLVPPCTAMKRAVQWWWNIITGEGRAPVGNSVLHSYSLEFVHSQANVTTNILIKRKNIYSVFCILQTALPLCYLSLCGTMLQCSLYSGHPVRNKEKSSFKMWFGLQERSKLTNISKKPLYERFIVCLFLKACQDVFPTGETVLFPFTT